MWILLIGLAAAAVVLAKGASSKGSPVPPISKIELDALNALPWIPIATNQVPRNPDGSGIKAHWSLPKGTLVAYGVQHGARAVDDLDHVVDLWGRVDADHAAGSSDPYLVTPIAVAKTFRLSEGEKLPSLCPTGMTGEVCDAMYVTPGKIVEYRAAGSAVP